MATLCEKYNINIPLYTSADGTTSIQNVSDNELSRELVRLYFNGKLEKVWVTYYPRMYYYRTPSENQVFYKPESLTEEDIENIQNQKKGGRRVGAGRKRSTGMPTETMRVPLYIKGLLQSVIDIYSDAHKEENKEIKQKTTVQERKAYIQELEYLIRYEKEKQLQSIKDEEDKRQLNLFDVDI